MTASIFGRVITAMVTPLTADGKLDTAGAAGLARELTRPGRNDGLVVNGTTGESGATTDDEKAALVRTVVDAVGDAVRVTAGVGTSDTQHSIELARQAYAAGAHALLACAPYYSRPSQAGIAAHLTAIADATPLPVMLYDIPKRTGVAIEADTLVALARHDRIVAVKDAKGDLEQASWLLRETELAYYSGEDALNLPYLSVGAVGFVSVAGHVVADRLRAMLSAYEAGDVTGARRIHTELLPVYRGIFRAPGTVLAKAALRKLGLPAGPVRLPLVDATRDERRQLYEDLAAAGVSPDPTRRTTGAC